MPYQQLDFSNLDGFRFETLQPRDIAHRFDEIQDLRLDHYEKVFEGRRSDAEIAHFVGRQTLSTWTKPDSAVGRTAAIGQSRPGAAVTVAFSDRSNDIWGYMYAAENVSSAKERLLTKLHAPKDFREKVGERERARHMKEGKVWVWGNEYVHDPRVPELAPVLAAICLSQFGQALKGTWYPWGEELDLHDNLRQWGYVRDGSKPQPQKGNAGFGIGSNPPYQTRMVLLPNIAVAQTKIRQIPGARDAIDLAERNHTVRP